MSEPSAGDADGEQEDEGGFKEAGKCIGCGTTIAAVDEETYRKMMASHVLEEHEDVAHDDVLDECREVLGS